MHQNRIEDRFDQNCFATIRHWGSIPSLYSPTNLGNELTEISHLFPSNVYGCSYINEKEAFSREISQLFDEVYLGFSIIWVKIEAGLTKVNLLSRYISVFI